MTRSEDATAPDSTEVPDPQPVPVLVGAYAALPPDREQQEAFYAGLAGPGIADGLEIPFRAALADDPAWFADQLRGHLSGSVLTLIPGTMVQVGATGVFGLGSPDPEGRRAALDHLGRARAAAEDINQRTGEDAISVLHIHSAPSITADPAMFARSLEELEANAGSWSTRLVLEHCDAYAPEIPGEKRFLSLEQEIPLAREAGIGMCINWGRSAVEAQHAERAREQIGALTEAGLLEGLMFSGAGPTANAYGGPWADAHLPLREDEPTSLLDAAEVRRCLQEATGDLRYAGAKIQVPAGAGIAERLAMIGRITRIIRAAPAA